MVHVQHYFETTSLTACCYLLSAPRLVPFLRPRWIETPPSTSILTTTTSNELGNVPSICKCWFDITILEYLKLGHISSSIQCLEAASPLPNQPSLTLHAILTHSDCRPLVTLVCDYAGVVSFNPHGSLPQLPTPVPTVCSAG